MIVILLKIDKQNEGLSGDVFLVYIATYNNYYLQYLPVNTEIAITCSVLKAC